MSAFFTRRRLLSGALQSAALGTAATLLPAHLRRAIAQTPARVGSLRDIKHVVLLMQENRSFDNYFGTLQGVRGFGDRFTIPLPNGLSVWQQRNASGAPVLPYHLDSSKGNAQRVSGTPHSWNDGQNAWDGGRMYQ